MKKLILLFAGIALLTVACKAEMNLQVDINEDRSGTIAFEFGLDDELRELLESSGGTTDDLFGELDLDIATEGGTVTERTDGDMTFTGATNDFDDISAGDDRPRGRHFGRGAVHRILFRHGRRVGRLGGDGFERGTRRG